MSIELRDGNIKGEFPPLGERNEDTLGNIPDPQIDPPRTIHLSTSLKYGNLTSKMYSEKGADMNKVNKDILERERYLYSPSGIILNESIDEDKLEIGWKNEMLSANNEIIKDELTKYYGIIQDLKGEIYNLRDKEWSSKCKVEELNRELKRTRAEKEEQMGDNRRLLLICEEAGLKEEGSEIRNMEIASAMNQSLPMVFKTNEIMNMENKKLVDGIVLVKLKLKQCYLKNEQMKYDLNIKNTLLEALSGELEEKNELIDSLREDVGEIGTQKEDNASKSLPSPPQITNFSPRRIHLIPNLESKLLPKCGDELTPPLDSQMIEMDQSPLSCTLKDHESQNTFTQISSSIAEESTIRDIVLIKYGESRNYVENKDLDGELWDGFDTNLDTDLLLQTIINKYQTHHSAHTKTTETENFYYS